MTRFIRYTAILATAWLASCTEVLEPKPVDLLVDNLVLNEPNDVEPARIGAYSALRGMSSTNMIAGDFTADYIRHNGTFNDYRELGTKQITSSNGAVASLWSNMYRTIYVANFILEKLPQISSVTEATRKQVSAEMRFLRGYAYFIGANTFGDIPKVTTTDQGTNRTIAKSPKADILAFVLEDWKAAETDLATIEAGSTATVVNGTYANKISARAMLARYYLYQKNWAQAEAFATQVIDSKVYTLETNFVDIVGKDFTKESILEVGYALSDDPGTSAFGLTNLFKSRREVIPSDQVVISLLSTESGTRRATVSFDSQNLKGDDNGWTVEKYGTPDNDNNNIVLMRLAEMYLIRAEARAQQNKLTGTSGAIADLNVLRARAKAPNVAATNQADVLSAVERERVYELAFEGHRWYDLLRTGRIQAVMTAFSPNWKSTYERWPIPNGEVLRNPSLKDAQNPGY
ncbi:RagB/SusD family nutrient uptake outer membrane protein [Larkinella rosea]|uniref:RagB/SusD family nutrient uptake outer membrane protein n=1 Tax=Larkinella rosea TaxID=2025312 RepID=A0A3P1BP13_9BACT|nr:RagB/SusD family nutrient uptake outer membrane protein [Larkinella rosea]RRB02801.1 RagB/SusD family nutrient uptake outer membrane protein [Larkinella rosea]